MGAYTQIAFSIIKFVSVYMVHICPRGSGDYLPVHQNNTSEFACDFRNRSRSGCISSCCAIPIVFYQFIEFVVVDDCNPRFCERNNDIHKNASRVQSLLGMKIRFPGTAGTNEVVPTSNMSVALKPFRQDHIA